MRFKIVLLAVSVAGLSPAIASNLNPLSVKPAKTDGDRMICRREVPIGSLIASRKTCYTATQWQKLSENAQREYERMNPHITTEHGN